MLDPRRSFQLFTAVAVLLQTYNERKLGDSWATLKRPGAETDDIVHEIAMVLRILSQFANKALADWYDIVDDAAAHSAAQATSAVNDAVLMGIRMVVPLITPRVLEYPKICTVFFKFMAFAVEAYPGRILQLGDAVTGGVLGAIRFGLQHHNTVVIRQCLRAVQEIAEFCAKQNGLVVSRKAKKLPPGRVPQPVNSVALQDWLRLLVDLVLSQKHVAEVLSDVSGALLSLIICEQPTFGAVANAYAARHPDPAARNALARAFRELLSTNGVVNNRVDRRNRTLFRVNLRTFVDRVRGFGTK